MVSLKIHGVYDICLYNAPQLASGPLGLRPGGNGGMLEYWKIRDV